MAFAPSSRNETAPRSLREAADTRVDDAQAYLCVSVQRVTVLLFVLTKVLTTQFRCVVAVPAVHVLVPSMFTLPLPRSSYPFPIGSAEEIPPASPLPAVAFMLLIPSVMVMLVNVPL